MKSMLKIISLGIVGALLFFLGAFLFIDNYVDENWHRASGSVIGSRVVEGVSSPVVEYEALATKFQVVSSDQPLLSSFETGDNLQIAYNPNSPGEAVVVAAGFIVILTWALLFFGAALMVIGLVWYKRLQGELYDDDEPEDEELIDTPTNRV